MKENIEYYIFIGCHDSQKLCEVVSEAELREMVTKFFMRKNINFSMYSAKGGYFHKDGKFVSENSLCINIIGAYDIDIIRLAKSLSMLMNQECSMVLKQVVKSEYN